MSVPSCFTLLSELKADWPRVLRRIEPQFRGFLSTADIRLLSLYSKNYRIPVLAIPHDRYIILNKDVALLNSIASAVNSQLVHKISGVRFVKPFDDKDLLLSIIDAFEAEILDVEANYEP